VNHLGTTSQLQRVPVQYAALITRADYSHLLTSSAPFICEAVSLRQVPPPSSARETGVVLQLISTSVNTSLADEGQDKVSSSSPTNIRVLTTLLRK
jgi:hypothetical protein